MKADESGSATLQELPPIDLAIPKTFQTASLAFG